MVACFRVALLVVAIACYALAWFGLDQRAHDLAANEQRPRIERKEERRGRWRPFHNHGGRIASVEVGDLVGKVHK